MCGIAGVLYGAGGRGSAAAAAAAAAMAATLAHRGPDDAGAWGSEDGRAGLAQRRLSIVDLSPLGRNPMPADGGRQWITFNGEIYNFRELRSELESIGHRFRTRTDTEVILAAYRQWDTGCVDRLVGMFAFAIWDEPKRRLWLVRDRLGKKPLYYSDWGGTLRFASELKAIVSDPAVPREIDRDALGLYLRYGYVPSPRTIYARVKKLPPAHALLCENGTITVARYWDPVSYALDGASAPSRTDAECEAELEARLSAAVRQRLIADVPIGAFLSGGVDSSMVVAMMQEQGAAPARTFTIRFDDPAFNEADYAAAVARHLRTDHHEETCGERQMLDVVDRLADMFDEPFADSSAIPTYLVSRIARASVTVALSGDGGDELFHGYPRHRLHARAAATMALPRGLRRAAALAADRLPTRRLRRIADVLRSDDPDHYARFISWWRSEDITTLTGQPAPEGEAYAEARARSAALARQDRAALLDLVSYLPEDILTKVDRASMAVGLEVRAPLLDHRVVEAALGMPASVKQRGRSGKWLLRRLLDRRVPRALTDRPKIGFGVPLASWLRGPLRERMDAYCAGPELADLGLDPTLVRGLWTAFVSGRTHRADLVWQMFVLIAWSRRFRAARPVLGEAARA
jgi:asparagine synthase (glutamine-hydrolysing)